MNYCEIKYTDIANGVGVRTALFVSGCRRHCKGCFNPGTWDFEAGEEFTSEIEQQIIDSLAPSYVNGLSILGGDPMEPENQEGLHNFIKKVKELYPEKTIWCYTGYTYDRDLIPGGDNYTLFTDEILNCIDVLVDGEFIEELKSLRLLFRGSSNQRLIDLPETRKSGKIVLWENN